MISKNIILGTANFCNKYNGFTVPKDEQNRIWDYCRKVGIDTVDTAFAYGKVEIPKDFKVITKIVPNNKLIRQYYGCLVHHKEDFDRLWPYLESQKKIGKVSKIGISGYRPSDIFPLINENNLDIIQLPYNIENTRAAELAALKGKMEIHFRSIFGRGELLKKYTAKQCLEFALNSIADKIIIGIDSLNHLQELI